MEERDNHSNLSGTILYGAKQWLEYSQKVDAMFCFACRLFAFQNDINEQSWMVNGVCGIVGFS